MAGVTMHPRPTPVMLHPRVVKGIAVEASLDIDWEGMQDDPAALIESYERIGGDIEYIRLLLSGELTEAWAVLRCLKQLSNESDKIAEQIGHELLRLDRFGKKRKKGLHREVEKRIKRLRKQAKRVWRDWRECRRFWEECMEHDRDQEAAARLGLGGGGAG